MVRSISFRFGGLGFRIYQGFLGLSVCQSYYSCLRVYEGFKLGDLAFGWLSVYFTGVLQSRWWLTGIEEGLPKVFVVSRVVSVSSKQRARNLGALRAVLCVLPHP